MRTQVVIGVFFGDEGKGSTVQWLCGKAIDRGERPVVVRFSGGPQAGHHVVTTSNDHVCSSFGSGVLLGVPTMLNENVMIDPVSLKMEYDVLRSKGINPQLFISKHCRIITPYDVLANIRDSKNMEDGSCGKGIYQTFKRCATSGSTSFDSWKPSSTTAFAMRHPKEFLDKTRAFHRLSKDEKLEQLFFEAVSWLNQLSVVFEDEGLPEKYDTVIYEGSQGLLLDMECGFMPNCTPSKVGLNGLPVSALPDAEVFMVMRPYITRHGNGFEPKGGELVSKHFSLYEPTNTDDGFQGRFKYGLFDECLMRRSFDRHHIDNYRKNYNLKTNLVITHLDCLLNDCLPFYNWKLELTSLSVGHFMKEMMNYCNTVYGSYSPVFANGQFIKFEEIDKITKFASGAH